MSNLNENGKRIGRPTKDGEKEKRLYEEWCERKRQEYLEYLEEVRENMKKGAIAVAGGIINISLLLGFILFSLGFYDAIAYVPMGGVTLALIIFVISYPGALLFVFQSISLFLIYLVICFIFKMEYIKEIGTSALVVGTAISLFILYRDVFLKILAAIAFLVVICLLIPVLPTIGAFFCNIGSFLWNYGLLLLIGILLLADIIYVIIIKFFKNRPLHDYWGGILLGIWLFILSIIIILFKIFNNNSIAHIILLIVFLIVSVALAIVTKMFKDTYL